MTPNPWTQAAVERMAVLFEGGMSCSQISTALGAEFHIRVSRNAVIGKAHRLGLKSQHKPGYNMHGRKRVPKPSQPRVVRRKPPSATLKPETPTVAVPIHVSLLDLEHGQCRYPYGDGPFTFCGCTVVPGSPYCAPHLLLCTQVYHGNKVRPAPKEWIAATRRHNIPKTIVLNPADEESA